MRRLLIAFVLLTPAFAWAQRPQHYLVQTDHVLQPADLADLAARGIEVQHVLPDHRYLIRAESADVLEGEVRLRSVEAYLPARKIAASAYREAARAHVFATVRVRFHDDVAFEDAQNAIEQAGGTIEQPLSVGFEFPHGLVARVPSATVAQLARDERIFGIYGPRLRPKNDNAVAAQLSHVPPLFTAPYNLTGNGVVLSLFELANADTSHPEFGGRLTSHLTGSATGSDSQHPTHVAGTMIAAGIEPRAKGMAPGATAQEFNALDDYAVMLDNKSTVLPGLLVVADNNSWGYSFGWQANSGSGPALVWYGEDDLFGAYTAPDSAPYDKVAHDTPVLFVHSAGNDASNGNPFFSSAFSPHAHVNDNGDVISGEIFCYSQNGTGTDCPAVTCSTGPEHCETVKHPTYGPFTTIGLIAATKNVIAVGAVDSAGGIASFSSRGPTRDGRVKPDVVAKGVSQLSTFPNGQYGRLSGTSMSSPVVTGISALFTEQWRKTFNGQSPSAETLKMLFIAGADDLSNPGPDYTFGFGLADAQASVDLILADNNTGSRIRSADIVQGQQIDTTFGLTATQKVRVVLGWEDPEVMLFADDVAGKTLVNDLDLKVIDPSGNTVLPYVLDPANPNAVATRGVNTVDNVEELEINNATPGTYRVIVTGTSVPTAPQRYVLIANAPLGTTAVTCTDANEPNDTPDTATPIANATPLPGRFCTQGDVDYFKFTAISPGSVTVTITATDTPVRMTMLTNGLSGPTKTIAAGATDTITIDFPAIVSAPGTMAMAVRVEPAGAIGTNASYVVTATYPFSAPARKRTVRH
jgi:hypothetical protein